MAVDVIRYFELACLYTNIPEVPIYPLQHNRYSSEYVYSDQFSDIVNTRLKHIKRFIYKKQSFNENQLEGHK